MRAALFVLIASLWMLGGCRDAAEKHPSGSQENEAPEQEAAVPTGDFYKRFTGTLAGKQITLHLHRAGDWIGGAYSYDAVGIPISLSAWNDSTPGDNVFDLMEFSEAGPVDESYAYPSLRLILAADGATGRWTSADSMRHYEVGLKEFYDNGSARMRVVSFADSARLLADKPAPQASVHFMSVEEAESGSETAFVKSAIQRLFGGGEGSWNAIFSAAARHFFVEYRAANEADTAAFSATESEMYDWSTEQRATVWENWDGWLVIRDFSAGYTGGAHGNYGSGFLVLDRKAKREWALTDVVSDTTALVTFLQAAALDRWRIDASTPLQDRLLVDAVPLTDNFYLTSSGLGFVYNPYEIASYADGEVHLFLPYKRIMLLLTEEFKQRMKLENSAAMRG